MKTEQRVVCEIGSPVEWQLLGRGLYAQRRAASSSAYGLAGCLRDLTHPWSGSF